MIKSWVAALARWNGPKFEYPRNEDSYPSSAHHSHINMYPINEWHVLKWSPPIVSKLPQKFQFSEIYPHPLARRSPPSIASRADRPTF